MSHTTRVLRKEVLYRDESTTRAGIRAIWRPEQKHVSWVKNLMRNFSRPEHLVMDFFADTCSTAKASMLPDQRRTFVGCKMNSKLLTTAEAKRLLATAFRVLNPKCDI